jgi:hypothetical protein
MTTRVDLPADPRWAPVATSVVHRSAGRIGFDVDRLDDVLLATDEVISCLIDETDPERMSVEVDEPAEGRLAVTITSADPRVALTVERWAATVAGALAGSLADSVDADGLPVRIRLVFTSR